MMFYDVLWCSMMFYDVLYCSLMFYDVPWWSMMFNGVLWCSLMFYDVLWCSMMFYDILWFSMIFYGVLWWSMMFYDVLWCSMVFYVLRAFLVSFCRGVPPEFLRSFFNFLTFMHDKQFLLHLKRLWTINLKVKNFVWNNFLATGLIRISFLWLFYIFQWVRPASGKVGQVIFLSCHCHCHCHTGEGEWYLEFGSGNEICSANSKILGTGNQF